MNWLEASYNAHAAVSQAALAFGFVAFGLLSSYVIAREFHDSKSVWPLRAGVALALLCVLQWPIYVFTLERPPTCRAPGERCVCK